MVTSERKGESPVLTQYAQITGRILRAVPVWIYCHCLMLASPALLSSCMTLAPFAVNATV